MSAPAPGRPAAALAALRWLAEMGADEAVEETARNRFAPPPARAPSPRAAPAPAGLSPANLPPASAAPAAAPGRAPFSVAPVRRLIEDARAAAAAASDVAALARAVAEFEGCALKRTAKNTVFADGNPAADLMLVGEAPGAEEDRRGLPFVGPAGRLLDLMLAAIGRDRSSAYISNVLFWRPPGNRTPSSEEIALCRPFVDRHIELVRPRVLACVGGIAAKSLLRQTTGITRLRGRWYSFSPGGAGGEIDATALFHPAYLLRQPGHKRQAWSDLLEIRARLEANA